MMSQKFVTLVYFISLPVRYALMETTTKVRNYEMFTKSGNKACDSLVNKVTKKILGQKRVTQEQITAIVKEGIQKIQEKHPEVTDTEPPYHISERINEALEKAGYDFEIDSYEIC